MATNSTGWQNAQEALRGTTAPSFSRVWWVDSSATQNGATGGYYPNFPANTLAVAQSLTTTGRGDVVYVSPSHTESVVGAAGITLSVDDVFYIGLGVGLARPVVTFSTSIAAQMVISGNGIVIRNMVFDCTGIDAITAAIKVTGASVAFEDCEFITNTGTAGCVLGILTAATATRFRVERCRFIGPAVNTGTTTTAPASKRTLASCQVRSSSHTPRSALMIPMAIICARWAACPSRSSCARQQPAPHRRAPPGRPRSKCRARAKVPTGRPARRARHGARSARP